MLGIAAYWLLIVLAGLAIVEFFALAWKPVERLAAAVAIGLVASTVVSFLMALAFGVGPATALGAPAILLLVFATARGGVWLRRLQPRSLPIHLSGLRRSSAETRWAAGVALVLALAFWLLFRGALYPGPAGSLLANSHVWADWAVHSSYVQSFFYGHNLPPTDILESATAMRYPFLVDFQPALLESLGQNLYGSLDISSWLIAWAATTLIWHLALRVTKGPGAASVALALVLLGGGLGFAGAYPDGCQQVASANAGFSAASCTHLSAATPVAVVKFLAHLPTELTHLPRSYDGEGPSASALPNLQWYEPLLVYWMPQRDFAFGMALVALVTILLWEALKRRSRLLLVTGGAVGALLPFFNPFGYLLLGLVGVWWLGRRLWLGGLAAYLVPLLVIGAPQLWFVVSGPHGQLGGPVGTNLFPQLDLGWLAHAGSACTAAQFQAKTPCDSLYLAGTSPGTLLAFAIHTLGQTSFYGEFLGFWISNTGIFTLLALALVVVSVIPGRLRGQLRALELTNFWAPFWLVFLLANLVITQPWNWDNTKLLSYWYLGAAIPVAWLLTAGRRLWVKLLAGVAVASLVLTGVLSLDAAFLGQSNLAGAPTSGASATFASAQAEQVGAVVRARTKPDAVFLTEGQPDDPVTTLAGRPVVLAYDGWLWSYGQPLAQRFQAVGEMYAGCAAHSRCQMGALLRRYRVSYVEFEPGDYNNIVANLSWFRAQHLPILVQSGGYVIFQVTRLW